jgi:hypothetical protein
MMLRFVSQHSSKLLLAAVLVAPHYPADEDAKKKNRIEYTKRLTKGK